MGFVKKKKQGFKERGIKLLGREGKEGRKVIKQKIPYFYKTRTLELLYSYANFLFICNKQVILLV
jgi:hypothetical protein